MRLIDADKLKVLVAVENDGTIATGKLVTELFDDMETVEAIPIKHGKWVKISPANIYECSKCGKNVMTNDISEYNFCHGCGADMRGERKEDDGV